MRQGNMFLAVVLAGSCVGVAPAWSQTSPQIPSGDKPAAQKQTDRQDQEKRQDGKQSGLTGQLDPSVKTQQTQPSDTAVADKPDKSMPQSSGENSRVDARTARSDVKKIQAALRDKGNDPGAIDGLMGPKTREAIKSFQTANSLPASGRIDAETSKRLGVEGQGSSILR